MAYLDGPARLTSFYYQYRTSCRSGLWQPRPTPWRLRQNSAVLEHLFHWALHTSVTREIFDFVTRLLSVITYLYGWIISSLDYTTEAAPPASRAHAHLEASTTPSSVNAGPST